MLDGHHQIAAPGLAKHEGKMHAMAETRRNHSTATWSGCLCRPGLCVMRIGHRGARFRIRTMPSENRECVPVLPGRRSRIGHRPGGARSGRSFAGAAVPVPASGKRPARVLAGVAQFLGGLHARPFRGVQCKSRARTRLISFSTSAPACGQARSHPGRRHPCCSRRSCPRTRSARHPTQRNSVHRSEP